MTTVQIAILAININVFLLGIIFLFLPKGNKHANIMLGLFLISASYVTFSMTMLEDIASIPFLIRVFEPFSLLILPSLYIYFARLIDEKKYFHPVEWIHFSPAIISTIILIPFIIKSNADKLIWLQASLQDYSFYKFWNYLILSQLIIYIVLFIHKIVYFYKEKNIKGNKRKLIRDVSYFTITLLIVFTIGITLMIIYIPRLYFIIFPVHFFVIYGTYRLIKSSSLIEIIYSNSTTKKVNQNGVTLLKEYLENTSDYFSPTITLEHVAKQCNSNVHEVSRYMNDMLGINFNDYINKKRVEEAKRRLYDPEYKHLSNEGIGQSVGFKSKTTFYRSFKKFTGKTPGEFMKKKPELTLQE
jgi:AraC-like DNA-binding protein